MVNNKHDRPDHDNTELPATLEGLRDAEFVQLTADVNDLFKEITISDGKVSLVFVRTIRQQPSGGIISVENVRETHDLKDIADTVKHNIGVMVMAAKMNGSTTFTRHKFFNP